MTDPQARDLLLALTPQPLPPNPAFPRSAVCRGAGDVSFAGDVGGRSTSGSGGDGGAGVRGDAGAGSSTSLSAHAEAYARAEAEALAEDPLCGADTRSLFALRRSRRYRAGTVAFVQWRRGWYAVRLTEVNPRAPTAKVTFLPPYAAYPDEWKHWWEIHFDDEAARGAAVTKAAAARRVRAVTQRTRYWPMATHPCTHAFLPACGACGDGGGGDGKVRRAVHLDQGGRRTPVAGTRAFAATFLEVMRRVRGRAAAPTPICRAGWVFPCALRLCLPRD
eukprot:SAG25_NODE_2674_length_1456_cov_1.422992_2_plen_277_part_00